MHKPLTIAVSVDRVGQKSSLIEEYSCWYPEIDYLYLPIRLTRA